MNDRRRIPLLILVMTGVAAGVLAVVAPALYNVSVDQQRERLVEMVSARAELMAAVAEFDAMTQDGAIRAYEATMSQIRKAHAGFEGFGATGEFVLAREVDGHIEFLLDQRHAGDGIAARRVPLGGDIAEPMSQALNGEAGTMIGRDYRGERVLAAYDFVPELDAGVVAKIDLAEIRAPFIRAASFAAALATLLIALGIMLFRSIGSPLIRRLEKSEQWFRALVQNSSDLVAVVDSDGVIDFMGGPVEPMLGCTAENLLNKPVYDIVHVEDHQQLAEAFDAVSSGETSFAEVRYRIRHNDGSWRPHHAICSRLLDHEEVQGIIVNSRDVTEQELMRLDLQQREERYRLLTETVSDLVTKTTPEGVYEFVSPSSRAVLGHEPEEMTGRSVYDFLENGAHMRLAHERVLASEGPLRFIHQARHKDGRLVWMETVGRARRNELGDVVEIVMTSRDRTAQKAAEDALRRRTVELQEKNQTLTETVAMLEAARAEAESAARARTAILTNMSHELRTPLTGIIGFADVLSDEISEEGRWIAQLIGKSGERLLMTLESVLNLAAIDGGMMDLSFERVDVAEELRGVASDLAQSAKEKGIELVCDCSESPVPAFADRGAVSRVLTNLIENAVKYTEEGSITLRTYQHGDRARIEVEDTGIGISNDFLPYVFDEFAQESTGDSRAYDGIGVGLAIARGLVEEMGGTISVKSHKGSGSTFAVELPASEIAEPDHADVLPAEADEGEHPRVLVVEDQPDTAYIMAGLLGSNFRTELAAGAEEALELARRNAYDVVLLDINLGAGRSGSDVLRELRERPEYESVPVIACTAYALDGDRERFLSEGFDAYIAKPVRRQALHEIVDEVLQAARQSI